VHDESVIVNEATPPHPKIETLSVKEWLETISEPRRVEILTTLATAIYEHNKQNAVKKQQAQETSDEQSD